MRESRKIAIVVTGWILFVVACFAALVAAVNAQTWIELPTTVKVPVLVHTPEAFAADLADTVTERVEAMLDDRSPCPDVADRRAWHLRLLRWRDIYDSMGNPGDPDVLTLRMVAEMWRTR